MRDLTPEGRKSTLFGYCCAFFGMPESAQLNIPSTIRIIP